MERGSRSHFYPPDLLVYIHLDPLPIGVAAPVLAAVRVEGGGLVGQALVEQQDPSPT